MEYLTELRMKAHIITCEVLDIPAFSLKRKIGPIINSPVSKKARITRVHRPRPRRYKAPRRFVYVTIPARKPPPPPPPMKIYIPYIFSLKLKNNFTLLEKSEA